jgi:hypothetical protein
LVESPSIANPGLSKLQLADEERRLREEAKRLAEEQKI